MNINPNVNRTVLSVFCLQSTICRFENPEHNTSKCDIMDFCVETRRRSTQTERSMYTVKNPTFFLNTWEPPLNVHAAPNFFCFFWKVLREKCQSNSFKCFCFCLQSTTCCFKDSEHNTSARNIIDFVLRPTSRQHNLQKNTNNDEPSVSFFMFQFPNDANVLRTWMCCQDLPVTN